MRAVQARRARMGVLIVALFSLVFSMVSPLFTAPSYAAGSVGVEIEELTAQTQPAGETFSYEVSITCSVVDGPCLTGGEVKLDIPEDFGEISYGNLPSQVESAEGDTITLKDIGNEAASFSIIVHIKSYKDLPDGEKIDFNATVLEEGEQVGQSNTVTAEVTRNKPTIDVSKTKKGVTERERGAEVEWTVTARCIPPAEGGGLFPELVVEDVFPEGVELIEHSHDSITSWDLLEESYDESTRTYRAEYDSRECGNRPTDAVNITFLAQVDADASLGEKVNVATGTLVFDDGTEDSASDSDKIRVIEKHDPVGIMRKYAIGYINSGSGAAYDDGMYPGEAANDARYVLHVSHDDTNVVWDIRDNVPCLDNSGGPDGREFSSLDGDGVCENPAFHVTSISYSEKVSGGISKHEPERGEAWLILTDGTRVKHEAESLGRVAEEYVGKVAAVEFTGISERNAVIQGYADESTKYDDKLVNHFDLSAYDVRDDSQDPIWEATSNKEDLYVLGTTTLRFLKSGFAGQWRLTTSIKYDKEIDHDLTIQDLLPTGSASPFEDGEKVDLTIDSVSASYPVKVEENFNDSGRTLLTITIPKEDINEKEGGVPGDAMIFLSFPADEELYGVSHNDALSFLGTPETGPAEDVIPLMPSVCQGPRSEVSDVLEFEGDGLVCFADDKIDNPPPSDYRGMKLTKEVKGSADESFQVNPAVGSMEPDGGTVEYRINWVNQSATTADGVVVYDIFPHVGDTGTITSTADTERGSNFSPDFVEVKDVPGDASVEYSTSQNPCRDEVYPDAENPGCEDDWSTDQPSDASDVTAIRVISTDKYKLSEGFSFKVEMTTDPVEDGDIAWNTVAAVSSTEGRDIGPIEAPRVGLTRVADPSLTIDKSVENEDAGSGDAATVGDTLTYTISTTNSGDGTLTDVVITDDFPDELTVTEISDGGSAADGVITWNVDSMAPGETVTVTVSGVYDKPAGDVEEIVNKVTSVGKFFEREIVSEPITPCKDDPDWACVSTPVELPFFDLSIDKKVDKATANEGDTLTYTVQVKNIGEDPGYLVGVADLMPEGVTYVSSTPEAHDVSPHPDTGRTMLSWTLYDDDRAPHVELDVGETFDIEVVGEIDEGVAVEGEEVTLTNYSLAAGYDGGDEMVPATAVEPCEDLGPLEGTQVESEVACAITVVPAISPGDPSLEIAKDVDKETAADGDELTYTVSVINNGEVDLDDVSVTDEMPEGVTYVADDAQGSHEDGVIEWDLGGLKAGEERVITITATIDDGVAGEEDTVLVNKVKSQGTDPSDPDDPVPAVPTEDTKCEDGSEWACAETTVPPTPVESVIPVAPEVTQAVCEAPGEVSDPVLAVAETEGVEYRVDGDIAPGSSVWVVAQPLDGYVFGEILGEGWSVEDSGAAVFEVSFDEVDCGEPTEPEDPDTPDPGEPVEPGPEDPADPEQPEEPGVQDPGDPVETDDPAVESIDSLEATGANAVFAALTALALVAGGVITMLVRRKGVGSAG